MRHLTALVFGLALLADSGGAAFAQGAAETISVGTFGQGIGPWCYYVAQDRGFKIALVTDGRLSGASGKVPAAIHVTPEAAAGGAIAKIRDGDMVRVDAPAGRLDVLVEDEEWAARPLESYDLSVAHRGVGRELFAAFRATVGKADQGASIFSVNG